MKKIFFLVFPVLLLTAFISWSFTTDNNWQNKVDASLLENAENGEVVEFLIILNEKANLEAAKKLKTKDEKATFVYNALKENATESQTNVTTLLDLENASYQTFFIINMIHTKGDIDLLEKVAEMPEVKVIQKNPVAKVSSFRVEENTVTNRDPDEITWGIGMIGADAVWAMGYTGQDVVVAGQDTGYEWDHPALKAKYRGWNGTNADHNYNWHDAIHEMSPLNGDDNNPCGYNLTAPCDDNNHGTHTMGTMVGTDGTNEIGVAPGAKWIACRNMERGWGQLTTYVECYEWFLAPTDINNENADPTKSPHVMNNSWGCPEVEGCNSGNFSIMEEALNNVRTAGTVVVVSAGNDGNQGCSSISNPSSIFENSFTVGATNDQDLIAGFSSRGPVLVDNSNRRKPDVSAPGVGVLSSIRNGEYSSFSGTSMAGPHIAGAVALIISANPELAGNVEAIENILEQTSIPKIADEDCGDISGNTTPNNTYGFGRINVLDAVEMALGMMVSNENVLSDSQVRVSPNPFKDMLNFSFEDLEGDAVLEVFNVNGQMVHSEKWNLVRNDSRHVTLSDLGDGIYFYRVSVGDGILEGKVVKL